MISTPCQNLHSHNIVKNTSTF